ncbi:helix-turn-helix domain-containing protein [Microvirga rosea]|uniref:helix-turn-helix domain-containing protein n=1 Tax=Microvirga rosea TaxID=2715425 RepID=UPI001D0AE67C|nr:cupin domain-containing protein [Microvirga rosea]MCB8819953.1 cupin domain-containing protein [Microvirga rosea]
MLSETLAAGLGQYEIGRKIRVLRQSKKLGLVQLGEHTSLSPALLSKIERGQIIPTLPTLLRIALVFGVGLDHFFAETSDRPKVAVVRKSERLRLPDRPGEQVPSYFFESLDFPVADRKLQAFLAEFPASSKESKPHQHNGAELVYVLKGRLTINIADGDFVLSEGDAIYFDSSAPHSYRCEERTPCSAIVVTTP